MLPLLRTVLVLVPLHSSKTLNETDRVCAIMSISSPQHNFWETKSGPLQEQYTLLTVQSSLPPNLAVNFKQMVPTKCQRNLQHLDKCFYMTTHVSNNHDFSRQWGLVLCGLLYSQAIMMNNGEIKKRTRFLNISYMYLLWYFFKKMFMFTTGIQISKEVA